MKNNKTLWIILGIIAVVVIMNSHNAGTFATTETCVSNEPSTLAGYNLNTLEQRLGFNSNSCKTIDGDFIDCTDIGKGLSIIPINKKSYSSCEDASIKEFPIIEIYKGVSIYNLMGSGLPIICSKKIDFITISVLDTNQPSDLTLTKKYIDNYYTCTTPSSSSSSGGTTNSGSTTGINLPNAEDTTSWFNQLILGIPLWAIAIIGIILLSLLTKQWWLLIIAPIIFFFVLKAEGIAGMGVG